MSNFRQPSPETLDNPENFCFFFSTDYRGFPLPADENEHRIWIVHVKIHKLKEFFSDDDKVK